MRVRQLSPTGDYTWGQSQQNFLIDVPAAVGQCVQTRLLLFAGEWYLDTNVGLQLIGGVIGKVQQSVADSNILDTVNGTQGLLGVSNYSSQVDDQRNFTVQMTINTIYGPLNNPLVLKMNPTGFSTLDTESGEYLLTESGEAIVI